VQINIVKSCTKPVFAFIPRIPDSFVLLLCFRSVIIIIIIIIGGGGGGNSSSSSSSSISSSGRVTVTAVLVVVVMEVKGCTNPAPQPARATTFCTVAINMWDLSMKLSSRQSSGT
jgi:hypothetical protein